MKLEIDNNIAEAIEVIAEQRKNEEYKKVGEYAPKIDGGKIFAYNRKTKKFKEATFRTSEEYRIGMPESKKLDVEKGHIYIEALNIKNAFKRLKRGEFVHVS